MMTPKKLIQTVKGIISVSGKIIYSDRKRRIDMKKPIRDLFEQGKREVGYIMEICMNEEKAVERIKELHKKNAIPVLLYFTEEDMGEIEGEIRLS